MYISECMNSMYAPWQLNDRVFLLAASGSEVLQNSLKCRHVFFNPLEWCERTPTSSTLSPGPGSSPPSTTPSRITSRISRNGRSTAPSSWSRPTAPWETGRRPSASYFGWQMWRMFQESGKDLTGLSGIRTFALVDCYQIKQQASFLLISELPRSCRSCCERQRSILNPIKSKANAQRLDWGLVKPVSFGGLNIDFLTTCSKGRDVFCL